MKTTCPFELLKPAKYVQTTAGSSDLHGTRKSKQWHSSRGTRRGRGSQPEYSNHDAGRLIDRRRQVKVVKEAILSTLFSSTYLNPRLIRVWVGWAIVTSLFLSSLYYTYGLDFEAMELNIGTVWVVMVTCSDAVLHAWFAFSSVGKSYWLELCTDAKVVARPSGW